MLSARAITIAQCSSSSLICIHLDALYEARGDAAKDTLCRVIELVTLKFLTVD